MAKNGSVAPKERINIKYVPATGDQQEEVELPLKLMILGDFKGEPDDQLLEDRKAVQINKHTFNDVMHELNLEKKISVPNKLNEDNENAPEDLTVSLSFKNINDFSPDNIAQQVPELTNLLKLREALLALRGPMGNIPAFRNQLKEIVADEASRKKLEQELDLILNQHDTE